MRWLALILCLLSSPVWASTYEVSNNPYRDVNWSTDTACLSQLHDHVNSVGRVATYDDVFYCAVTAMDYAGAWDVDNVLLGWGYPRRWPPTDFGFTDPSLLTNIKFYIPGAEEAGWENDVGGQTSHFHSPFMTQYIESFACSGCGPGGIDVPTPENAAPIGDEFRYFSDQELIDLINSLGGLAILNHPSIGDGKDEIRWGAIEMFNTFMALRDEANFLGKSNRIAEALALWDDVLETRSARIWGVAVNDQYGPYRPPSSGHGNDQIPDPLTADHVDQGKIVVMIASEDLATYEAAFRKGAFFAVQEDSSASKGAYPVVTDIDVPESSGSITITTSAGDETVTWTANGSEVCAGQGFSCDLETLPTGMKYVRAEIDDGAGRILYTQAFELTVPIGSSGRSFGASVR